ncbi:anti-sigma factor [uncultured Friedmanniella sp.]|uniref:anti-sigma factor n=1 Tax=uncultured Friedmanniella sp. TaxID=335381 RepID=UPI0035C95C41
MHTDPELLGLLALGEDLGDEDGVLHAQTCPTCSADLAQLLEVVTLGRTVGEEGPLLAPSGDVWARISSELALDRSVHPLTEPSTPPPPDSVEGFRSAHGVRAQAHLVPASSSWSQASGTASLSNDAHGRRVLQVALHADLPASGVRQAWLIHRDDPTRRQTLGILDGNDGLWTVDHSVDLEQYAILDISQQEIGDTEHSGKSLVRGELTLTS